VRIMPRAELLVVLRWVYGSGEGDLERRGPY